MGLGSVRDNIERMTMPKELRKIIPKELSGKYHGDLVDEALGYGPLKPGEVPDIPTAPPPESYDIDAARARDRARRRTRGGYGRQGQVSGASAPATGQPKTLLGS
jgi:hypothetical protein